MSMMNLDRYSKMLSALLLVLAMAVTASAQQPGGTPMIRPVLINDLVPAPEYWLGLECLPVPAALRSQLELPEKQGLMVETVVPDSPAAKAGIVRHDILWSIGEKPLTHPLELIQAIETAKTEKLALEVIHIGKRTTVEITPAKRPDGANRKMVRMPGEADWNMIQNWMDRQSSGNNGQPGPGPLQFRFFHPGAILPHEAPPPMPSNMSIVVSKEGDQPAKIVVKQGQETWETTEKELHTLPAEVRPYVERLLGHGPLGIAGIERLRDPLSDPAAPVAPSPNTAGKDSPNDRRLEQQLEEMSRRMEQMMKLLDEPGRKTVRPQTGGADQPATKSENSEK